MDRNNVLQAWTHLKWLGTLRAIYRMQAADSQKMPKLSKNAPWGPKLTVTFSLNTRARGHAAEKWLQYVALWQLNNSARDAKRRIMINLSQFGKTKRHYYGTFWRLSTIIPFSNQLGLNSFVEHWKIAIITRKNILVLLFLSILYYDTSRIIVWAWPWSTTSFD